MLYPVEQRRTSVRLGSACQLGNTRDTFGGAFGTGFGWVIMAGWDGIIIATTRQPSGRTSVHSVFLIDAFF